MDFEHLNNSYLDLSKYKILCIWPSLKHCWYRDYKSDPRNVKYELLKVFIIKHGNFLIVKE